MVCPRCGRENRPSAGFCTACGQALGAAAVQGNREGGGSLDWRRLVGEARAGARRFWPLLGLLGMAGLFDFRMNGQIWFPIIFGGVAALAVVFMRRVQSRLKVLEQIMPARFVGPVLAGASVAVVYLIRWTGTQGGFSSVVTALLIAGFGIVTGLYRSQINRFLTPFYEARNRYLPKLVRMGLMFVLPVFLTFLIAHGSLSDIGALFGGSTDSPSAASTGGAGFRILLTAVLSAVSVYLLLNEPQPDVTHAGA